MVCSNRPYHFQLFQGCLSQTFTGTILEYIVSYVIRLKWSKMKIKLRWYRISLRYKRTWYTFVLHFLNLTPIKLEKSVQKLPPSAWSKRTKWPNWCCHPPKGLAKSYGYNSLTLTPYHKKKIKKRKKKDLISTNNRAYTHWLYEQRI